MDLNEVLIENDLIHLTNKLQEEGIANIETVKLLSSDADLQSIAPKIGDRIRLQSI